MAPVGKHGPIAVRLDHVTFRYPGATRPALPDVSLEIPAGALVAVTGPVGSGKSALARSLLGLYPLDQGSILLDGRALTDMSDQERAARLGYLAQEPHLFSGTVRANVLLDGAPVCSDKHESGGDHRLLHDAVKWAALVDDLRTFPAGLDTEIGEFGLRVSGGQRQRIALARAIAAHYGHMPGLLVLDDPFSSVDVDTEAQIIANLRAVFGLSAPRAQQATIVLCSHRLAICPQADLVVVLECGRIVEQGTHAELLQAGQLYARIFRAQRQAAQLVAKEVTQ
jgi:ABC-type bacteriocin/lantibiotic exporter with double-glycine peptidase domain